MASGDEFDIPESGAVFTFGRSRFSDNQPSHFFIRNDPVVDIACGDEHTVLICQKGRTFAFGSNDSGQLGLGHSRAIEKPTCVKIVKPWTMRLAACGKSHTLLTSDCGRVFACGANGDGQLGLGDRQVRLVPTELSLNLDGKQILAIAAGCLHSALLTEDGEVLTWGGNGDGQCGQGSVDAVLTPTKLTLDIPITSISCGYYHTILCSSEDVWGMGEGDSGKLGLGASDGNQATPQKVSFMDPIHPVQVAAGGSHTLVLTDDGRVFGFGSNFSGQLGSGPSPAMLEPVHIALPSSMKKIAAGESHSAFLTEKGEIWTCGDGRHGKLCYDPADGTTGSEPGLVEALLPYEVDGISCGGCHTMVLAKQRTDSQNLNDADADVVEQILPPLKTRKQMISLPSADDSIGATPAEGEEGEAAPTGTEGLPTTPGNGGEGDSLTESCAGVLDEDKQTEPQVESIHDEVQVRPVKEKSRKKKSPRTEVEKKESDKEESQVEVDAPSKGRFRGLARLFRGRAKIETATSNGVQGDQGASKACVIL